jgi:hypothetical protein
MSCTWTIISIYYNNLQKKLFKNCSKIQLYEKIILGQKDMQSFFEVTLLVHFILFAPYSYKTLNVI